MIKPVSLGSNFNKVKIVTHIGNKFYSYKSNYYVIWVIWYMVLPSGVVYDVIQIQHHYKAFTLKN